MANYLTTDTELTSVADAIRAKGGTSAQLTYPAEFVSAIQAIPTGGGDTLAKRLLNGLSTDTADFAVPDGVRQIRSYAFAYTSFGNITLPSSCTAISGNGFAYYKGTGKITIPSTVTTFYTVTTGSYFSNIGYAGSFPDGYADKAEIEINADIPESAVRVMQGGHLKSVSLPTTMTGLGDYFFNSTKIYTAPDLSHITSFGANCCSGLEVGSGHVFTEIPTGTTKIGNSAFNNNGGDPVFTEVPSTLTSALGDRAFYGCTSVGPVLKIKCSAIGTSTTCLSFANCTGLRYVWISSGCTTIPNTSTGNGPFYGCDSSIKIYCEAASKPRGWKANWNYITTNTKIDPSTYNGWGVTEEQFDEIVANAGL